MWDLLKNKNNGNIKWKAMGNLRNQRMRQQNVVDLGWEKSLLLREGTTVIPSEVEGKEIKHIQR